MKRLIITVSILVLAASSYAGDAKTAAKGSCPMAGQSCCSDKAACTKTTKLMTPKAAVAAGADKQLAKSAS
jgi:hypothetical protein